MQIDIILISFIVAYLRGGRLLEIPRFEKLFLLITSIVLQLISIFIPQINGELVSFSYLLILLFFYYNREYEDIRIFMIGWFMNALVIWLNNGRMPVDPEQAKRLADYKYDALVNGQDYKHVLMNEDTLLPFLGDIFYLPVIIPKIISIGDIFVMFGAFLMIQRFMNKPISLIKLREGNSHVTKSK